MSGNLRGYSAAELRKYPTESGKHVLIICIKTDHVPYILIESLTLSIFIAENVRLGLVHPRMLSPTIRYHAIASLTEIFTCQVIILLVPLTYLGFILYRRRQAQQQGLPPPSFNPFSHSTTTAPSRIYPAPSGIIGWVKNKYYSLRNTRSRDTEGGYEQTSSGGRGRRGLDPDEAWDARVGQEADGYGGYYEEQELGLRPPSGTEGLDVGAPAAPHEHQLPEYGGEEMQRGRRRSREEDTTYIGGGQRGLDRRFEEETGYRGASTGRAERENPFGDQAEVAGSLRGVSPRPHGEAEGYRHQKEGSDGGSLKAGDSPTERRSMFREENV